MNHTVSVSAVLSCLCTAEQVVCKVAVMEKVVLNADLITDTLFKALRPLVFPAGGETNFTDYQFLLTAPLMFH